MLISGSERQFILDGSKESGQVGAAGVLNSWVALLENFTECDNPIMVCIKLGEDLFDRRATRQIGLNFAFGGRGSVRVQQDIRYGTSGERRNS